MDAVPYDFIEKVLTSMDRTTIMYTINGRFESALWDKAAADTKSKLICLHCYIAAAENGFRCQFNEYRKPTQVFSFDDVLKMDHRFTRIINFATMDTLPESEADDLPADRLPAIIDFVSRFLLEGLSINFGLMEQKCAHLLKRLQYALFNYELRSSELCIWYSVDALNFLKTQLLKDDLQTVNLVNVWPQEVKEDLMTFMCQPKSRRIRVDFMCFTVDDIKTIIAYWKTLEKPWTNASISMQGVDFRDEFASCMTLYSNYEFVESFGDLRVRVLCHTPMCSINFEENGPFRNEVYSDPEDYEVYDDSDDNVD